MIARKNVNFKTGSYPVIFTPRALADILCALQSGLNGMSLALGTTPLKNKLDKKILSTKISITDNPFIPHSSRSVPFDDEGIPACENLLIEKGKLRSFMHSLQTAHMTKSQPTGNGFRIKRLYESKDVTVKPSVDRSNWVFSTGKTSVEEMISQIDNGVLVSMLMGSFMGNIISGDFSGNMWLGYHIKNGKIIGRIKNGMVSGNIYKILGSKLIDLSPELEMKTQSSGFYLPHALCKDVSVSC